MVEQARKRGLDGWVRNRSDGSVEAILSGPPDDVGALALACRRGPPAAHVTGICEYPAEAPRQAGFFTLPTLL
jgi:acylphosphatase